MINRIPVIIIILLLIIFPVQFSISPVQSAGDDNDLFTFIWQCLQKTHEQYRLCSGNITETRNSDLFREPVIFTGKFYAMDPDKFRLEYTDPESMTIIFNEDYANIALKQQSMNTDVINIKKNVQRTKNYFSGDKGLKNLKHDFQITASENSDYYKIKLVPRKSRFKKRVNYIGIWLDKKNYLLKKFELDGKNGVNSIFMIENLEINPEKFDEDTFRVYRPKTGYQQK